MKTTQITQNFKVTKQSPIAEQIGQKRASVTYDINALEPADIPELNAEHVALILNNSLETYAKKLFAASPTNWDYVPTLDQVTIDNLYADLTAESKRGGNRLLTKETLSDFADYYNKVAVSILGKSDTSARNGAEVIRQKLTPVLGNAKALEVFATNLGALTESDEFDDKYLPILEALLEIATDAMDVNISADAL